jgi:hypothetical protein
MLRPSQLQLTRLDRVFKLHRNYFRVELFIGIPFLFELRLDLCVLVHTLDQLFLCLVLCRLDSFKHVCLKCTQLRFELCVFRL